MSASNTSHQSDERIENGTVYDKVIFGAGPGGVLAAYKIARLCHDVGTSAKIAIVSPTIHSPAQAGTQVFNGSESSYVHGHTPEIDVIRRKGRSDLYRLIEEGQILCRFTRGLEIKAASQGELEEFGRDICEKNVFLPEEMSVNSDNQKMKFHAFPHSMMFGEAAQVNLPAFQAELLKRFAAMGGAVIIGPRYLGQTIGSPGLRTIHTDAGDMSTSKKPLLATGADHLLSLEELHGTGKVVYSMSVVFGPLSPEDRQRVSSGPISFAVIGANSDLSADFPWGGIDEQGYLTCGTGDSADPDGGPAVLEEIMSFMRRHFPHIAQKYQPISTHYGAMYVTNNNEPIIGRLPHYDVLGGGGGRFLDDASAAATAYAEDLVYGTSPVLDAYERMQPDLPFAANQTPDQPVTG